jgi:Domain of unknown function (DUF6475)
MMTDLKENYAGQALRAWNKVMEAVRRVGVYRTVIFDDPLIHRVIWEMGGWQAICAMRTKDQPFKAKEFEKLYTHYVSYPPNAYPWQLVGITDSANIGQGYSTSLPVLVGDEQRALQVFKNGQEADELLSFKALSSEQYAALIKSKE